MQEKQKYKMTDEHKYKLRLANLGKKRSEQTKQKLRELRALPRPNARHPKQKLQCPHCLREIAINLINRWHNDNCKEKRFDK